jgi:hypoxanthine phosphoribosyltransferase
MSEQLVELHSAEEIAGRVRAIAAEISEASRQRELTVLGVLEDAFVFLSDLLRALDAPLRTAFLRYEHRTLGGVQDLSFITPLDLRGRDVVLVEGVMGTGVTQEYIVKQLESRGAARVRLCVLVDKTDERRTTVEPDWRAFETHEPYVVGYGLGFQERWRELPYLAKLAGKD